MTTGNEQPGNGDRHGNASEREYERSGMYPERGKPYRLWGLLGFLLLVVVFMAGASAVLNYIYTP